MWCFLTCALLASLHVTRVAAAEAVIAWNHTELAVDEHRFTMLERVQSHEVANWHERRWDVDYNGTLALVRHYFFLYHDLPLEAKTERTMRQLARLRPILEDIDADEFVQQWAQFRRRFHLPAIVEANFCWNNTGLVADGHEETLLQLNLELGRYYNPYYNRKFKPKKDDCGGVSKFVECAAKWNPDHKALQEAYRNLSRYTVECPSMEGIWDQVQDFYGNARLSLALGMMGFNTSSLHEAGLLHSSYARVRHLLGSLFPRYAHMLRWWRPADEEGTLNTHGGFLRASLGALVQRDRGIVRVGLRRDALLVLQHFDERRSTAAGLRYPDYLSNVVKLTTYVDKLLIGYAEVVPSCEACPASVRNLTDSIDNVPAVWAAVQVLLAKSGVGEDGTEGHLRWATEQYRALTSSDIVPGGVARLLVTREALHHVLLFALPFLVPPGAPLARVLALLEQSAAHAHLYFPSWNTHPDKVTAEMLYNALETYSNMQQLHEDKMAYQEVLNVFDQDATNYYVNLITDHQLNKYQERLEVLRRAISRPRAELEASAQHVQIWLLANLAVYVRHLPDVRRYAHLHHGVYLRDAADVLLSRGLVPDHVARHLRLLLPTCCQVQTAVIAENLGGERLEERRRKLKLMVGVPR